MALLELTKNIAISIWSCSRWGFPCIFCYQKTGVLLPHLFTLALIRRFIFCGTIPKVTLARCYLASCSYGARTFLSYYQCNKSDQSIVWHSVNKQKRGLNQVFLKFFVKLVAIIKHSLSIIPLINSGL